jgi:4-aminobutyrate aminotransferase-like enzyme
MCRDGVHLDTSCCLTMQVVLPDGYLRDVYEEMRAEGAVCVADEVRPSEAAA